MPDIYQYPPARAGIIKEIGKNEGDGVDRIEFNPGILIYLKGHTHPSKGLPTPEALVAVNTVKRLAKALLRFKIMPSLFWSESALVMRPYILKPEYQQDFTKELTKLLEHFVNHERAETISHIFEYDRAYRFRLLDLLNETSYPQFAINGPVREIGRLINLNGYRDYAAVHTKIRTVGRLRFLLLWPPLRKKFMHALYEANYLNLIPDANECYWMRKQVDYRYNV